MRDTAWVLRNRTYYTRMTKKAAFMLGVFALVGVIVLWKLIDESIFSSYDYTVNAMSNFGYSSQEESAPRGTITDRNGNILAYSETQYMLILEPKTILDSDHYYKDATVLALCTALELDEDEILSIMEENSSSLYFRYRDENDTALILTANQKNAFEEMEDLINDSSGASKKTLLAQMFGVSEEELAQLYPNYASFKVEGVWFETCYDRVYPYGTLACKVVGFYSEYNPESSTGIENTYNLDLTGIAGKTYGYLGSDLTYNAQSVEPVQGNTVVSTIDVEIQAIVEEAITDYTSKYDVENIAAIVMNPNNGEILAMTNGTFYDPNDPDAALEGYTEEEWASMSAEDKAVPLNEVYKNYCISSSYEPGSIFKPITIAAALEEGAISGDETFYCGGYTIVNNYRIRCHNRGGCGELSVMGALANSCNVSLMEIASRLGKADFSTYFNRFGFGQLTGIDLPGEVDCKTLVYSDFTTQPDVTLACASFGQGFNVTMIQMAAAFSSLVNGGYYYTPHVVKEVKTVDGVSVSTADTDVQYSTISALTSEYMKEALYTVVEDGTGGYVRIEGYNIGGKTGTAEMVENGERLEDKWVLSFISAAPIEDPQLLVYVVVDRTSDELYDSSKPAQDIAKAIWTELLPYYNIHSNLDEYDYLIPEETSAPADDSSDGPLVEEVTEEETSEQTENWESVDAGAETSATEETAVETPAPEETAVETPAPEETAVETPAPEETAAETPAPEETAAQTPAPETVAETAAETVAETPAP